MKGWTAWPKANEGLYKPHSPGDAPLPSLRGRRQPIIGFLIQKIVDIRSVGRLHLEQPAIAGGLGVDEAWLFREPTIDRQDFTGDRRIDVGGSLHGFDSCGHRTFVERRTYARQFDKYKIAEFLLGKGGDPHGGNVAVHAEPFVILGKSEHGHLQKPLAMFITRRHEWQVRNDNGEALAADFRKNPRTRSCGARRNIAHRNRDIEAHRKAAGSHDTDLRGIAFATKQRCAGAYRRPPFPS